MMPKAICFRCNRKWAGWALTQKEHRLCECGFELIVFMHHTDYERFLESLEKAEIRDIGKV